ncbi:MAG: RHS repeat-associated core domain-containing protein, partial [Chitinophagaceae bacterium]
MPPKHLISATNPPRPMGSFEIYRKFEGSSLKIKRTTVHISDDTGRIAMLEARTFGSAADDGGTDETLTRYIYSNHLQSASLELDESVEIISYEEYHPYGTTAYQTKSSTITAVAKRYRYTGKERDEESGLYYHGARYYVPWLCRWCACEPLVNLIYLLFKGSNEDDDDLIHESAYCYCRCNPTIYSDPTGERVTPRNTSAPARSAPVRTSTPPRGTVTPRTIRLERMNEYPTGRGTSTIVIPTRGGDVPVAVNDNNGGGHASVTIIKLLDAYERAFPTPSRPAHDGDLVVLKMKRAQLGEQLSPNLVNAYANTYASRQPVRYAPLERITNDIRNLTEKEKKEIFNRVSTGNATANDRMYFARLVAERGNNLMAGFLLHNIVLKSSIGNTRIQLDGSHSLEKVMTAGMMFVGKNAKPVYAPESGRFIGWESA